jgi:hypothetical protein
MKHPCWILALALVAPSSAADPSPSASAKRSELTIFGGATLKTLRGDGTPFFPILLPAIYTLRTELDGGALLGVRFTRYLTSRAAVELDLTVVPSQDLAFRGEPVCGGFPCRDRFVCLAIGCPVLGIPEYLIEERLTSWQYSAAFTYDLTQGDVRPYLGAAFGASTAVGLDQSHTDVRPGLVLGVKLGGGRLRGRFEVGDFLTSSHFLTDRSEHDVQVRAGLTVGLQ